LFVFVGSCFFGTIQKTGYEMIHFMSSGTEPKTLTNQPRQRMDSPASCATTVAAPYLLQTNPITQPRVRYIHITAIPHTSCTLHYAGCPPPSKKDKFAPSLTGDINPKVLTGKNENCLFLPVPGRTKFGLERVDSQSLNN